MASNKLLFRILAPHGEVIAKEVDAATLMASEGEVGILPGHAAFLAALRAGEASCRVGEDVRYFALSDGFLEVADDVVTALVRSAEPAHEIDLERAERRRREREDELEKELSDRHQRHAEASLEKQVIRIQVAGRLG